MDVAGSYTLQLIVNDGHEDSDPDTVVINTINSRPVANAGPDLTGVVNQTVQLDGSASSDADGDPLSYRWSFTSIPDTSQAVLSDSTLVDPTFIPDIAGLYVVQLIVNDGKLTSEPNTTEVTILVGECAPGQTAVYYTGPSDTQGVGVCHSGTKTCQSTGAFGACVGQVLPSTDIPNNGIDENCDGHDAVCTSGETTACYDGPSSTRGVGQCRDGAKTCGTDGLFGACAGEVLPQPDIPNNGIDEDCNDADQTTLPPDPSTVAPPVDQGVTTTIGSATTFLYSGTNPIQTGVAPGTIEPKRAAVLRGKVLDKTNAPLSGVAIGILNHPEFGQTLSRADGMFDLAVNGGGLLTVTYTKATYLSAQRQLQTPWQDYLTLPDVMLVPLDAQVTPVDLTSPTAHLYR